MLRIPDSGFRFPGFRVAPLVIQRQLNHYSDIVETPFKVLLKFSDVASAVSSRRWKMFRSCKAGYAKEGVHRNCLSSLTFE